MTRLRQQVIGLRRQIAVDKHFAGLIDQSDVHGLGLQVDTAVELVLLFVKSHHGPPWDWSASRARKTLGLK